MIVFHAMYLQGMMINKSIKKNDENMQYELLLKFHFAYQHGYFHTMLALLPKEQQSFLNALLLCKCCQRYAAKLTRNSYTEHQPTDLTTEILNIVLPSSRFVIIQFEKPNDKHLGALKPYPQLDEFELQSYSSEESSWLFSSKVIGTKKEAQDVLESKILEGKKESKVSFLELIKVQKYLNKVVILHFQDRN